MVGQPTFRPAAVGARAPSVGIASRAPRHTVAIVREAFITSQHLCFYVRLLFFPSIASVGGLPPLRPCLLPGHSASPAATSVLGELHHGPEDGVGGGGKQRRKERKRHCRKKRETTMARISCDILYIYSSFAVMSSSGLGELLMGPSADFVIVGITLCSVCMRI